eukprot:CAMPEP_0184690094 /NCGR_PEP_ID=MMETSP0312-20130426/31025_1 /TAXON_ID=31354 /ORGANISM="Compsopogon coeruleus, Strain SAG 36.94" /LENGTH=304 /DNA_ID=CAMNT_0027147529 /DNA_START=69 /DNA_END=983 /DNA_ORIENTATION=-
MRTAKLSSLRRWISTRFFTASSFRQALSESEKPRVQAESIKTVHAAKEAVARKWQATPRIIQTSHDQIAAQAYCLNLVRTFDHENFLVNLVLPNRLRRAHAALRALNVELVRIRDHVTNEDLGRIRTAWYRAAVDAIAEGKPPKTPVAEELARVVRDAPGVIRWLHRLVDAREEDLQHPRIVDLGELDQVGEKSQGSLLYAMMELARGPMETEREHLTAELVAKAYGLCIMLRAVPYNAKSRISFVPSTLLKQYEISPREVLKPETTIQTRAVFRDIALLKQVRKSPRLKKKRLVQRPSHGNIP